MSDAERPNYARDPGDRFASDVHRRVLAHLSLPDDNYGWRVEVLVNRMSADESTNINSAREMTIILEDLESDGHAVRVPVGDQEVWKMTQDGFDVLNGPMKDEPPPGAAVLGPAMLELHRAESSATMITSNGHEE